MNTAQSPLNPATATGASGNSPLPAIVQAQFEHIIEDGTVTIAGYAGDGGAIIIPDTIFGRPVTRIGPRTFDGCFSLPV